MNPLTRSSFLAAAAALLAGGGTTGSTPGSQALDEARAAQTQSAPGAKAAQQLRRAELRDTAAWSIFGRGGWNRPRYPRPGWSVRQGQRAARKAANQRRHRRACRKGGRK